MNKQIRWILLVLFSFTCGEWIVAEDYRIIPAVQEMKMGEEALILDSLVTISYTVELENEAALLVKYLDGDWGIRSEKSTVSDGLIELCIDADFQAPSEEGYELVVSAGKVRIASSTATGVFYGIQTLRQLIVKHKERLEIPEVHIKDYPAFSWRAFMLDEARSFKGKDIVFLLLDEMARLKMNVFHWHLTDDQGWRIEIKKYPRLTEIGAWRDSTQIGGYRGTVFDGKRHGGFYTQKEIGEVVAYAAERHITVIPEFEMPGHESAAIAAYPWLGTTGRQITVPCRFGVQYDVMDVTSPQVQDFVEDVLDEMIALFPSSVIHIGGDEVKFDQWNASTKVQAYMRRQNISTPADLQIIFTNHISHLLKQKKRRMMGWNDITGNKIHEYNTEADATAREKLAEGTIVQFWKGDLELIEQTAAQGYDIVNSYHYMTYLDYDYQKISLEKAYGFSPIPDGLPAELRKRILGLGCQMWGEEIMENDSMFHQIFPRIAAYAECGWTLPDRKNYAAFQKSLYRLEHIWEVMGLLKND